MNRSRQDWNVVVSVSGDCYKRARKLLRSFGAVEHTDYYNVLTLAVTDVPGFLETLRQAVEQEPELRDCIARAIPATHHFLFQSAEEFEAQAKAVAAQFAPQLTGKSFYVRMHRRGFRNRLASPHEERLLDEFLLDALERAGAPGSIRFTDPDAVIAVETVGPWAGLSLWKREDLRRYPFVRVD